VAVFLVLAALLPVRAQNRVEAEGRWSDTHEGGLAIVIVNCYRAAKTCTIVSAGVGNNLMSNDHDIVRWDSEKIVATGGGDCFTNTLVVNLSQKSVSMTSASNTRTAAMAPVRKWISVQSGLNPSHWCNPLEAGSWFTRTRRAGLRVRPFYPWK